MTRPTSDPARRTARLAVAVLAAAVAVVSIWRLEAARDGIGMRRIAVGATPVTLYRPAAPSDALVVVAHGFAGSRQMMEAFSLTLARSGANVAAFDFRGHGRNPAPLSPDVTEITGTTAGLVVETQEVASQVASRLGIAGEPAFLGHSMATDVIIRAARDRPGSRTVVAVSMYSEAVTPDAPPRLLIVSGAREGRLREVALAAVAQVAAPAAEGETARAGDMARRAAVAPLVGHVGVLWHPESLREARDWIAPALGLAAAPVARTGPWIAALLVSVVALGWPLARLAPVGPRPGCGAGAGRLALAVAVPSALGASAAVGLAATGPYAGIIAVAGFLAIHGAAQAALLPAVVRGRWGAGLARAGLRGSLAVLAGAAVVLVWHALFTVALDRYGASFAVTGPRWIVAAILLPGAVVFALADRLLVVGRGAIWRIAARLAPVAALAAAMALRPTTLGLAFTALPVLVLFQAVYGTVAGWVAGRAGPVAAALGLGPALAWALAASLPVFAAP